jgi:hypothetical protein
MTTRVWGGNTASLFNPLAWTPSGQPAAGDSLDIVSATAVASQKVLGDLSIQLGAEAFSVAAAGPAILQLWNSVIAADTTIAVGGIPLPQSFSGQTSATIAAFGLNTNDGTISVASFTQPNGDFAEPASQLTIHLEGPRATFVNTGTLRTGNTPATLVVETQRSDAVLVNDGLIEAGTVVVLDLNVIGTGTMQFGVPYDIGPSPHALTGPSMQTIGAVGLGQTVDFRATTGVDSHGVLSIADPRDFHALIRDFASSTIFPGIAPLFHEDTIQLDLSGLASSSYQGNVTGGVLTLTGGTEVAQLRFAGNYSLGSFQITSSSSAVDIIVKTA